MDRTEARKRLERASGRSDPNEHSLPGIEHRDVRKVLALLDEVEEERDYLAAGCRGVHEDTGWCPACSGHEHDEECPLFEKTEGDEL